MTPSPSCTTCDFMRYVNETMRCFWDAPTPTLIAVIPNRIAGALPIPVVTGISPEVSPDQFCRHHPDLRFEGDVAMSPGLAPKPEPGEPAPEMMRGGLILPPGVGETRQ